MKLTYGIALLFMICNCFLYNSNSSRLLFPVSFTVVRQNSISGGLQKYMKNIGYPNLNDLGHNVGYNIIALDGFRTDTVATSLSNDLSPLGTWTNVYSRILGNAKNQYGINSWDVQKYIIQQFHNVGSKIIFNAFSLEQPISNKKANASMMAQTIASFVKDYNFDGVSIDFQDFHAIVDNSASEWLTVLLKNLRKSLSKEKIIVVQIHPTAISQISLFKSPLINSYVDLFVLKYYNVIQNDYNSYQTVFKQASVYNQTALWQIQTSETLRIDVCKTVIGKPSSVSTTWNRNNFVAANTLNTAFNQAKSELGWYGGYANPDFGSDSNAEFQLVVLNSLRKECYRFQDCLCI